MTLFDQLWDGKHMTYDHSFAMILAKVCVLVSLLLFLVKILLCLIFSYIYQKIKPQKTFLSMGVPDIFLSSDQNQKCVASIVVETINLVIFWVIIGMLAIILVGYSVFNLISSWLCGFLILLLGTCALLIQIWRHSLFQKDRKFKNRCQKAASQFKILLGIQFGIILFFSIFLPIAFQKGCLCVYNTAYGIETFFDLQFSTKWTRSNWLPDEICKKGQLCHIYATLPINTDKEVFINVHSGIDILELKMIMKSGENKNEFNCEKIPFPSNVEDRGQRNVFTCLGLDLEPYTLYDIDLIYKDKILNSTKYKTIAEKSSSDDLIILFGGDWGYREKGIQIVNQISKVNPDAILIGGDIAYDNGNIHCYYSFDLLLNVFEFQFIKMNRIVPFIFSVGNHDVGFNDYAFYNITVSDESGPLYFTYFPQQKSSENKVLPIKHRVTYNLHRMQNIQLFGLDSGYLYPHAGIQEEWMKHILKSSNDYSNFAHYHVPIYPSCYNNNSFLNSWINIMEAQRIWVPLFDQYEFVGAFENHVHQFKRTYPLKNNKISNKGTVYFGDGSMGIRTENCPDEEKMYLKGMPFEEMFETVITNNSDHFWVLKSFGKNGTINFNAYQPDNTFIQNSNYSITSKLNKQKKIITDF